MNANKLPIIQSANFWIILAVIAFFLLPSHALDYGLFESTSDEYLGAMGWSSLDITALWFLPVILYGLMPLLKLPKDTQAKAEIYLVAAATLFIFVSATIYKVSMGYSVIVLIASLTALATFSFAKLKVMQGDKFIIASLLCIILLIFFFIVYPTLAIFVSMFYDGDTFAPQQVMRILTQSYIVRVISNSLFLSGFVGIVSTIFGLAFALYTTRIARRTAFENRFACAQGFAALGADARSEGRLLYLGGNAKLHGATVTAPDLRGGAALVLAGLGVGDGSCVRVLDAGHIRRGYADLAGDLRRLGADCRAGRTGTEAGRQTKKL